MDYYLKTTSKEYFIHDLSLLDIGIELEDDYFQDKTIIIDWIGLIPNPVEIDEEGDTIGEITFKEGFHVNVRSVDPIAIEIFNHTHLIYPSTPYRVFS